MVTEEYFDSSEHDQYTRPITRSRAKKTTHSQKVLVHANTLMEEHFHISMGTGWNSSHGEILLYPLKLSHSIIGAMIVTKRWFID